MTATRQCMTALAEANRVRLARADLKRQINTGQRSILGVILDPPDFMESCEISELLMAQTRWGITRTRRLLAVIPVPENKPVGSLTARQRHALICRLDGPRIEQDYLDRAQAELDARAEIEHHTMTGQAMP